MRRFVRVAAPWGVLALSAAMALSAVALGLSGGDSELVLIFSTAVLGMVFAVTGALIVSRSSGNFIGWIFCVLALLFEASILGEAYVGHGALRPGSAWVAWVNQSLNNTLAPALIILCFLLFPTGRLPSARWRAVVWTVAIVAAAHTVSVALAPGVLTDSGLENPAGVEAAPYLRTIAEASIFILVVPMMLLAAASIFARMRRSSGVERQQIKWFAYAAALLAANLLAANVLDRLLGGTFDNEAADLVFFLIFAAALSGIPVAMGFAILRHRLYDIDVLINKTLVYGALTASLALVYFGGVVGLQRLLSPLVGEGNQLAVVASTLAIAALFGPLRRRIQNFIDHRFYRRKYDARKTLDDFSVRLRSETSLETLGDELVSVARETVQPEHVSVWLRSPGGARENGKGGRV